MNKDAIQKHDWDDLWSNFNESFAQNPGRIYRYELIKEYLQQFQVDNPQSIIDMGCGTGDLLDFLSKGLEADLLLGLDTSAAGISLAQKKFPALRFRLIGDDTPLSLRDLNIDPVDIVICSEVLEHLDKPEKTLEYISKILSPNGRVIVTVPAGPMSFFEKYIGHRRHYSRRTLMQLLTASGFYDISIIRSGFPGINLIRILSFIRGKKILKDIKQSSKNSVIFMICSKFILLILKMSKKDSRFGWQLIAVGRPSETKV